MAIFASRLHPVSYTSKPVPTSQELLTSLRHSIRFVLLLVCYSLIVKSSQRECSIMKTNFILKLINLVFISEKLVDPGDELQKLIATSVFTS